MKWQHFAPSCNVQTIGARSYHWNPFRYAADAVHVAGVFVCLVMLLRHRQRDRRAEGVSLKTQALYLAVFSMRYLNLFFCKQFIYLVILKVTFWGTTLVIVLLLLLGQARHDKRDTCPVRLLLVPAAVVTLLLASYDSVVEVLWTFSQHLEGFAMLPQYIYCYRDAGSRPGHPRGLALLYVLCLGGYRSLYGLNWMYKYFFGYVDLSSWLSGLLNVTLFTDFLAFRLRGFSPLSRVALAVDDGLHEAERFAAGLLFRGVLPGELRADFPQQAPARKPVLSSGSVVGRPQEVELHGSSKRGFIETA